MKKQLTALSVAVAAASLMMATPGFAHKNYKGESFKDMPAPCPEPKMLKDGWYAGIQAGYDSYRVRQSLVDQIDIAANPVINNTGWVGGLFLGYGKYLTDLFYLGGEGFVNYSGAETTWSASKTLASGATDTFSSKIKAQASYGLALIPGLRLNDTTLGYIRLGYNWVNLKGTLRVNDNGNTASKSKTNTSNGFNFGVGMETLLVDNWSARAEFNHTYLNNFTNTVHYADDTTSVKYGPSDNQFTVGLVYHFA